MQIHMIGNGASNKLFQSPYGFKIMCNIPKLPVPADVISIIDQKVLLYQQQEKFQFKHNQVIWCTPQIQQVAEKKQLLGDWQPVYQHQHRYNSGHLAVQHACRTSPNLKIVHLWGMDSMFSSDLTSQMDDRVKRPQRPPLNREWRPNWKTVFAQFLQIQFLIHIHTPIEDYNYGQNVKKIIHQD